MNFFIDFEATQFSNEIISIGCISEKGDEFHSYVRSEKKITSFITSLTGITDEVRQTAPTSDEVFSKFFQWLCAHTEDDIVTFYCYGTSDSKFIRKNLSKTNSFAAQAALSLIAMNLYDYSNIVKAHFGLAKHISLIKLVAYYRNEESVIQTHDALEDARFLKEVFEHVSNEEIVTGHPFPEYETVASAQPTITTQTDKPDWSECVVEMYNKSGTTLIKSFQGLHKAVSYAVNHINVADRERADKTKIKNRILKAINGNTLYMDKTWKIIMPKEDKNE